MKLILFFLFLSVSAFAQQIFYLKDKVTENSIAYASIFNDKGTFKINSESDGSFTIPEDLKNETIIIESIGYELMQTNLDNSVIYLNEKSETLKEMIIIPRLGTKEIKVGNDVLQKSSKFSHSNQFITGSNLKFGMKFFVDNTNYSYLKEIHLKTKSKIKDAKFEIRIYDVNEKGEPGQLLHDKPIYGIAIKGTSVTKINIEHLQLLLNSNSFFVFF